MMKLLNKRQKSNGGFSLVELIVVIAIMVVLVAVLAPVFSKYIESSRRSTDVQNANSIAEAVLADASDNKITADTTALVEDKQGGGTNVSAIAKAPVAKGDAVYQGGKFQFQYTKATNEVKVYVCDESDNPDTTYDLATEAGGQAYKDK